MGGHKFASFNSKDISNYKAKLGRGTKYKDMAETLSYFEELKKNDPNFYYKIDLDANDRVRICFGLTEQLGQHTRNLEIVYHLTRHT